MRGPLRFATYLAPNALPVYEAVAEWVGRRVGIPTELSVGNGYERLENGSEDVAFICGLPYVGLADRPDPAVVPIAAPVLAGGRYGGLPIYFSDVIVRRAHPASRFEDLAGASWAYNERDSQSGYGIMRAKLVEIGATGGFFGRIVETGLHQRSIRMVADGHVDASAIDSQVLAIELKGHPDLAERLRIVDTLGPSTIQPVVAARRLPVPLRKALTQAILEAGDDPRARAGLDRGLVDGFVSIGDGAYDDIRAMKAAAQRAGLEGFGRERGWQPLTTAHGDGDKETV
jgi:phosphonate transport system substrate-binding protein